MLVMDRLNTQRCQEFRPQSTVCPLI